MSLSCRLITKPMCLTGVYRQSTIFSDFPKMISYQQFLVRYSSKSCDTGNSESGWNFPDSCSDKTTGKGSSDPCDPCSCPSPPSDSNPSSPTMYDLRKYGHNLPKNDVRMNFEPLPSIATGIFRSTDSETLGLGAGKSCLYKNPEYFSFHHMTYYDMHLIMRCFRRPSPKTGRKP